MKLKELMANKHFELEIRNHFQALKEYSEDGDLESGWTNLHRALTSSAAYKKQWI